MLDPLGCRIVAALQCGPRNSWATIAEVLGESDRTVSRRGRELLESGEIKVVGVTGSTGAVILRARCAVGAARTVAGGLARREDTTFVYAVTGQEDCVAELWTDDAHLPELVLDDLPHIAGIRRLRVDPVTMLYRSVREWRPSILTPREAAALSPRPQVIHQPDGTSSADISAIHRSILRILQADGRTPLADIARLVGITENTARRHLDWLEVHHQSRLRVVVAPALLGFPAEAVAWVKVAPNNHDRLVSALLDCSEVRYAAALGGADTLFVNLACQDRQKLHRIVTQSKWARLARSVSLSTVLEATKRSGSRLQSTSSAAYLY